jgi:hypothetical protein
VNNSFRFAPELFEYKSKALEILADNDLVWMVDFSGIDVIHDIYGLEIEGIPNEDIAIDICSSLHGTLAVLELPEICKWMHDRIYREYSGWVYEITKYPHPKIESWLSPEDEYTP